MFNPDIIGLTGPAGCGKDSVALILQTHVGFSQHAFADGVRAELCAAYNCDASVFTGRASKTTPTQWLAFNQCRNHEFVGLMLRLEAMANPSTDFASFLLQDRTPRELMRLWGTEFRRESGINYWTSRLVARVNQQQKMGQARQVISDVRFANEAETIRSMGGKIWQITRPGVAVDSSHVSETDGTSFQPDVIINNDGDTDHLASIVLGAWLMREARVTAHDVVRMGMAMVPAANAEFHAHTTGKLDVRVMAPEYTGATA